MGIAADEAIDCYTDITEQAEVVNQGRIPNPQQWGIGEIIFSAEKMQHQHSENRYTFQHF